MARLVPAKSDRKKSQRGREACHENWSQALFRLEALSQVAREVGDWELAEFTANQMIEHDRAYAGSHLALALASEHRGDRAALAPALAAAARYWGDADPDLPELALIRSKKVASR